MLAREGLTNTLYLSDPYTIIKVNTIKNILCYRGSTIVDSIFLGMITKISPLGTSAAYPKT